MSHPHVPLSALSGDARSLYAHLSRPGVSLFRLDRDWLDPRSRRMPGNALDPDFEPSGRLLAAVQELSGAGYVRHALDGFHRMVLVDPDLYTAATGDGDWDVRVYRVPQPGLPGTEGELIAALDGAELVTGVDTGGELHIKVRVPEARDAEHDQSFAALIAVQLPTAPQISGARLSFWGVAAQTCLYPLGTDPTLLDERTGEPIPGPAWCDRDRCADTPHPLAPYLPPTVDLARALLCIEASPRGVQDGS